MSLVYENWSDVLFACTIMLYGCEIWGTQPKASLEIFYRIFI